MNDLRKSTGLPPALEALNDPKEINGYSVTQLEELAGACRERIIEVTSQRGGHLASSLGAVELTLALAKVFDLNKDKIVFDVGHQAYTYKLITDRKERFSALGQKDGIAKFPNRFESPYDHFGVGHASTSISAALGIGVGCTLNQDDFKTVAIIGDGALTGGLAFEAMNHAGHLEENLIVILNDNEMSIDPVVGAVSKMIINFQSSKAVNLFRDEISHQTKEHRLPKAIKTGLKKLNDSFMAFFTHGSWFEGLNFRYFGQIDGHNLKDLISLLEHTKDIKGPILLHVSTQKGKGYDPAESAPLNYHGVSAFDTASGEMIKKPSPGPSFTQIWSETFAEIMAEDDKSVAISAAMLGNTGLAELEKRHPDRVFDVGIAEGHAVTFAAGLATEGIHPWVVIYSTFLQRAIDHIVHDVALQNLPVKFILDRGGFVGYDGATHHGVLDLTYLRMIPRMTLLAPSSGRELAEMLRFMQGYQDGPIALRFPRANCAEFPTQGPLETPIELGKGELLQSGEDCLILAVGNMVKSAAEILDQLQAKGYTIGLINARFIKPLDRDLILQEAKKAKALVTIEENAIAGGFSSAVMELLSAEGVVKPLLGIGIPDQFFEHASREEQLQAAGLDSESLLKRISEFLDNQKQE